ncbi:hypothetical protein B0H17DRAFT_1123819 [Mycena rosella]|uniref:RNA-dependent RNA polymerase n=1 Tax=Mycena rosella TaxID=1033263 RepID=A0AAD7MCJ6_MYCRO|nr:hypothetical protein B0H17DRAFT_1123819 [Mycena rosella]
MGRQGRARGAQCLELAKLNSDAVDFAKSGVPANLREYPDFMYKPPGKSYPSQEVLGVMFRLIDPAPEYIPVSVLHANPRLVTQVLLPLYLKEAGAKKQWYDIELQGILKQYSLSEGEIFAGGPVKEAMEALRKKFRAIAREFMKNNPSLHGLETWAVACYQVTHVFAQDQSDANSTSVVEQTDLISFPWLWAQELCDTLDDSVIKEE